MWGTKGSWCLGLSICALGTLASGADESLFCGQPHRTLEKRGVLGIAEEVGPKGRGRLAESWHFSPLLGTQEWR